MIWQVLSLLVGLASVQGEVGHNETDDTISLTSSRLNIHVNKTLGAMTGLEFDNIDILGPVKGRLGMGYFDCFCVPSVSSAPPTPENPNPASSRHYYVGQSTTANYTLLDGDGWVGLIMSETYAPTGQFFQQWWFLRDGETGYHSFTRLQYENTTLENIGNLQEFRQVISPNTDIWTDLVTNPHQLGSLPSKGAIAEQVLVQDATWYYNVSAGNPYKEESSDYFTKYQWADFYGDHKAHGFYANGTNSNGTTLGFWTIFSNLEGYTGGPLRSDLVVDTNIYNYYASNHRGAATMNITTGFDRIFGPSFIYLNRDGDVQDLLSDAEQYANSSFASDFYDEIAGHIPGYVPNSGRGDFIAKITLPEGAGVTKAVLSMNGADMQDNVDYSAGQYWTNVTDGLIQIPLVKAGTYRLTIYAEGVFGQYEQDDVQIKAGDGQGAPYEVTWKPEAHGKELFRLGVPDKTAGEFRHGFAPDPNHTLHQDQYRQYWGAYDFPTDFPTGVNYTIGTSDPAKDWNYVHYSRYGGTYDRPGFETEHINIWQLNWVPDQPFEVQGKNATMTVQLASARTPSGNTDLPEPSSEDSNLNLTLSVNSNELIWTILYNQSSSCSDRNGIGCYNLRHLYEFPAEWLNQDEINVFEFILPYNSSGGDSNFRNYSVSVMYDAIRLEVDL